MKKKLVLCKLQTIVILGAIIWLSYCPFLFAGEDEQNMAARMTTSSVGFTGEDQSFISRTGLFYESYNHTDFKRSYKTSNFRDSLNVELVSRSLYGPSYSVFIHDDLAFIGTRASLMIFDISNPLEPSLLGHIAIHLDIVTDIYVVDEYAYVSQTYMHGSKSGIQIVDISDPTSPYEVSYYNTGGFLFGIYATSDYIYSCLSNDSEPFNGLLILDVSDPANPIDISLLDFGGGPFGYWTQEVEVVGNYAYVASCGNGLKIVDISNPTAPNLVGTFPSGNDGCNRDVVVSGDYAYLTFDYMDVDSLVITNISNPTQPNKIGGCELPDGSIKLYIAGNYAYVARQEGGYPQQGGLLIIDISDPANPFEIGSCNVEGSPFKVHGNTSFAYVAAQAGGFAVVDVSDVIEPAQISNFYTGFLAHSVEVVGNYAYIADYNIWNPNYTARGALRIMDISNSTNPIIVGYLRSEYQCMEISVQLPYAYIGDEEGGLRIVDVSDPTNPFEMGYFNPTNFYAYGIDAVGDYVYICSSIDWAGSLYILNISDPTNPFVTGICNIPNPRRVFVNGNYAYVASNSGMYIIDVSNPESPFEVGCYPSSPVREAYVANNIAYIANSASGLKIVDVSDPANPMEISSHDTRGKAISVFLSGNFAYVGSRFMMGGIASIEVIDISDIYNPEMEGYFDLYDDGYDVFVEGDFIYLANGQSGFYILQYTGGVGIEENNTSASAINNLFQSYPNPFNSNTTISYQLKEPGKVILNIYNIQGQLVNMLVDEYQENGKHSILWDGTNDAGNPVSGGIYFYKMEFGDKYTGFKKMILMK